MSVGQVEWGIVGPGAKLAYYFRGEAIEGCGKAEAQASAGQVVVDERLGVILRAQGVELIAHREGFNRLEVDPFRKRVLSPARARISVPRMPVQQPRIVSRFFPQRLFEAPLPGEFRNAAIVFINFDRHLAFDDLNRFVSRAIREADLLDGHFSEIDFGDKGGVLLFYFGAPVGHENDVKRALNFVLTLREKLSDDHLSHLKWRSGITFGPVYAGLTGTSFRGKYSLLGLTVNFSARLMDQAKWGQVYVSEIVSQESEFLFKHVGDFGYKGFNTPVSTYQLLGERPVYEKNFVLPMVGRNAELEQLLEALSPIYKNQFAGVAIVCGEPGIGKSRLTHELRQVLPGRVTWLTAQNDHVLRQPFSPFIHLLKQYFRQLPETTQNTNRAAFELQLEQLLTQLQTRAQQPQQSVGSTSLSMLGTTVRQKKSFLGALMGIRWTDSLYDHVDGSGRFQNTLLAIKSLILAESRLRPVVLEIEDANRLDEASQEMINFLTYNTSSYPLFILITTRYEEDGAIPSFKYAPGTPLIHVELKELPSEIVRRLAKDLLDDSVDDNLVEVLLEKTRGNPYFAQQVLYYFQDNGFIERRKQAEKSIWGVQNLPAHDLPASIQPILVAQIDQFSPSLREAVLAASVLGRQFDIHVLSHILGKDAQAITTEAEREQVWELVDGIHYAFRHELLRDAAHKIQMDAWLHQLHRKAAEAYETLYPNTLQRYFVELAYHYNQAQEPEKERQYTQLAGDQAAARFANKEALQYYARALELLPAGEHDTHFELLVAREKIYKLLGDRQAQALELNRLSELVQTLGDPHKQAKVALRWANYWELVNDYAAAQLAAQQAIENAGQKDPESPQTASLVAKGHLIWGRTLIALSDYAAAREHMEPALEIFMSIGEELEAARALQFLGTIFTYQANYDLALKHYREALHVYRKTGNREGEAHILNNLGTIAADQGNPVEEKSYYELALQIRKEIGDRHGEADTLNNLGLSERALGEYALARDYYRQALEIYFEVQDRFGEQTALHNLGEAFYYEKMYLEALASYRQALFISREIGDRDGEALSLQHIGNVLRDTGSLEQAEVHFHQALTLHRALGRLQYEAEELTGLVDVALAHQNNAQALAYVQEISAILARNPTLDGSEQPFRVYLTCYHVLATAGDPRAVQMLQDAYQLLMARRDQILDTEMRRKFIESNPWHREVLELWEQQHG